MTSSYIFKINFMIFHNLFFNLLQIQFQKRQKFFLEIGRKRKKWFLLRAGLQKLKFVWLLKSIFLAKIWHNNNNNIKLYHYSGLCPLLRLFGLLRFTPLRFLRLLRIFPRCLFRLLIRLRITVVVVSILFSVMTI